MTPIRIANVLWDEASKLLVPPQLAIVIVSDADFCAFRHNCVAGLPALAASLREFADKLENGDARGMLTDVSRGTTS